MAKFDMKTGILHGLKVMVDDDCPSLLKSFNSLGCPPFSREFAQKIENGTAVRLNNPYFKKDGTVFHLLYRMETDDFFVSLSKLRKEISSIELPVVKLMKIMSTSEFCLRHRGLDTIHYVRSAKKAHAKSGSSTYYQWRHDFLKDHDPLFYQELKMRKIEVFITYGENKGERDSRATLGKPEIPLEFLKSEGPHNAMHHPNFWTWFYKSIEIRSEFLKDKLDRATGIYLELIDESPIPINYPNMGWA